MPPMDSPAPLINAAQKEPSPGAIEAFESAAMLTMCDVNDAVKVLDVRHQMTRNGLRAAYAVDFTAVDADDLALAANLLVRLLNGHGTGRRADDVRALASRLRAASLTSVRRTEAKMEGP